MATLKPVIFKAKALTDGRHKIRIAVCHKQETSYIVTRFIINDLSEFKNGQVTKRPDASIINTKLRHLLNEYQDKLDKINNQSLYSCKQLKNMIVFSAESCDRKTFQSVSDDYVVQLQKSGSVGYAKLIERNCRYFTEFARGEIILEDITPPMIAAYSDFLKTNKGIGNTTNGISMRITKTIINRAISKMLVRYEIHPFINLSIKSAPVRELDISLDSFSKIKNLQTKERRYSVARDLFCLSFYLGGINLIDLLEIDFRGKNHIEYIRTKSRNTTIGSNSITIPIHKFARDIINRWMNRNTGKLDFGYSFTYSNFSRYLSRSIALMASNLGIREKVVYYSARKTFAQFASELGIPDNVIDYCLGHSDKSRGVIRYYTKVKEKQAEIAINRVIDYVNNPEAYKEYIEMRADIMMIKG